MNDGFQVKPERELRFRDIWWPVFYFFWHNTWFIRRIWCKHNGVHMSDSSKGPWTMCANCFSKDVPQCCGTQAR
jgi:hypothetical protein